MQSYSAYLFDLDGTLVDTAPDINVALNYVLEQAGMPMVDESLTRHWIGHGARILVEQALMHQNAAAADLDAMHQAFLDRYQLHVADHSQPYPGVRETLRVLQARGAKLAVVTNKRTQFTLPLLEALDLAAAFEAVVCGDTAAVPKPAADPALHACNLLAITPGDALCVGDSTTDVDCARAAGCPVVCVRDGYNHGVPADELGADVVIESLLDLV